MPWRITLSHYLFYFGLALMLGNEILSATVLSHTGSAQPLMTYLNPASLQQRQKLFKYLLFVHPILKKNNSKSRYK